MSEQHPLGHILRGAAFGRFPPPDGLIEVLPGFEGVAAVVNAFSGHTFVSADLTLAEVVAHLPTDDPGAPMTPAFLAWLGARLHAFSPDTPWLVLAAIRCAREPSFPLHEREDLFDHPRALAARRYRRDVRVFSDAGDAGMLTIGWGPDGRAEVSVEVKAHERNRGLGRRLALAARSLVGEDEPLFASISPGNATSLRAFLAAGFVPLCSEVVLLHVG